MAKKATKNTHSIAENSASAASPRTTVSRAKKHIKAQAAGVAAAVESFVQSVAAPAPVDHEAIAKLAYQFYLDRGGREGSQAEDWLRAEAALKAKSASAS